ncbi:MAG: Zn-dependent hydrolase [Vicinamibacterales bacterium]|nr:Zn-dependent hydrolase [Vicinamibacterales bacterium]
MTRRQFLALSAAIAAWTPAVAGQAPRIQPGRLRARLEMLSTFGRPDGGTFSDGVSRVAYSDADVAARAWLMDELRGAGLAPRIDPAGNIFARVEGRDPARPPIVFGSHIDTVPNGGNFDGSLGTLAALEVLESLAAAKWTTRHPLELVVWAHEEGVAFTQGLSGSRIVAGDVPDDVLERTWNGMTRAEALRRIGGAPERLRDAVRAPGAHHCYLELHIEQGGTLDTRKVPIGIVTGIVAIHRHEVRVTGMANHAGTTPMDQRQDALIAAARGVLAVRAVGAARQGPQVATVGRLDVVPNAPNVIPGEVTFTVELRDLSEDLLALMADEIRERLDLIAQETGTTMAMRQVSRNPAAAAAPRVQEAIIAAAGDEGLAALRLPSGAGHDAQMMARLGPMGMIFVPSVGGVSHAPAEFTSWDDCARGAQVLLVAVLAADARDTMV